jgi:hypothetical protein
MLAVQGGMLLGSLEGRRVWRHEGERGVGADLRGTRYDVCPWFFVCLFVCLCLRWWVKLDGTTLVSAVSKLQGSP